MAEWSDTTKHPASSFNAGNQYTKNDQMSIEALNNNIENALYAARVAENAQSATNNAVSYNAQTPLATEQKQAQKNLGIDQTISFAESERQKSKNLFPFGNVNGTKQVQRFISLPAGTYTLSTIATSSDTDANTCLVGFYNNTDEWIGGGQLARGTRQSITVSLAQPTYSIFFFASNNQSNSEGDTFTFADIQIEEGSTATDYQPYNGAIVRKGELYPVDSIYISVSSTSPASLFGGTWEELASGNTLWIIPTTDSSGGGTIDAGLPNITASLDRLSGSVYWPSDSTYGGAFSLSQVGSHKVPTGSSSNYSSGELQFSASKSNSIYGNSTTVQPPAIKVYAWKRVE